MSRTGAFSRVTPWGLLGCLLAGCVPGFITSPDASFALGRFAGGTETPVPAGGAPQPQATPAPSVSETVDMPELLRQQGGARWDGRPASPHFSGWVRLASAATPEGIAGAWIATRDGRWATTDAEGRFSLPGQPPADGVYTAGAPGHITSVVNGWRPDDALVFHLEPLAYRTPLLNTPNEAIPVTVSGQITTPTGDPAAGVLVVLGGGGVRTSVVAYSDASGRFTLRPRLRQASPSQATLLAHGAAGMAMITNVPLTGGNQALEPARLSPFTHAVRIEVAAAPQMPAPVPVLRLQATDGTTLSLAGVGPHRLAEFPNLDVALTISTVTSDGGRFSEISRPALKLDWSQPETQLTEAMLVPPGLRDVETLSPDARLDWEPVPGARGYTLEVNSVERVAGLPWEAFAPAPPAFFILPRDNFPPGFYRLGITAWDVPNLSMRSLAQTEPRYLKRVPTAAGFRRAVRRVSLSL